MRIILLGPPGCGKGTQASTLASKLGIIAIASGDMFREAFRNGTEVGLEAKSYMEAGDLVPDDTTIRLVCERLHEHDCAAGFILDGFPRTIPQAQELGRRIPIDRVIDMQCDDEVIIKRISGRRVHPSSCRVYHVDHHPPKVEGVDDETGEPLIQRSDDEPETVAKRLAVYAAQTKPLSDYYAKGGAEMPVYRLLDAEQDIAAMGQALLTATTD